MGTRVDPASPPVELTPDELLQRLALLAKNQSIVNDAQWTTLVSTVFNATNASGLSATTRTFLIEFFTKFIGVGRNGA